jgi:hypothetical protein
MWQAHRRAAQQHPLREKRTDAVARETEIQPLAPHAEIARAAGRESGEDRSVKVAAC